MGIGLVLGGFLSFDEARSESFSVGPVDARIEAPEGFEFLDYRLRVRWFCQKTNPLIAAIAPAGWTRCGRRKSGEVSVPVARDGRFSLPRVSGVRWSPFTISEFIVYLEVLRGEGEPPFGRDDLSRAAFWEGVEREEALRSLRLIRFGGASTSARLMALLEGKEVPLSEVRRRHPASSIFIRTTLQVSLPGAEDASLLLPGELSETGLRIQGRDRVAFQPRIGSRLTYSLRLEVSTQLRTAEAGFVHYSCLRESRRAATTLAEDNPIPVSLLAPVVLTLDLDNPTRCVVSR